MSILGAIMDFLKTYALGLTAAAASTGFAAYMIVHGGAGGLGIGGDIVVAHVPVDSPLEKRPQNGIMPTRMKLPEEVSPAANPIITGSLKDEKHEEKPRAVPVQTVEQNPGNGGVPKYVLRFATRQLALLEGAGRLWSVEPGDELPGAGRVMRIVRKAGNRWAVETFDGKRRHIFTSD